MSQANTAIQQNRTNEDAEIGSKNYQKLKVSIEKVKIICNVYVFLLFTFYFYEYFF